MLGICFYTLRGEYTGEPLWEGEKGVADFVFVGGDFLKVERREFEWRHLEDDLAVRVHQHAFALHLLHLDLHLLNHRLGLARPFDEVVGLLVTGDEHRQHQHQQQAQMAEEGVSEIAPQPPVFAMPISRVRPERIPNAGHGLGLRRHPELLLIHR